MTLAIAGMNPSDRVAWPMIADHLDDCGLAVQAAVFRGGNGEAVAMLLTGSEASTKDGSGDGSGSGYGSGSGSGYGYGYGNGDGDGSGSGDGYGYGDGSGDGYGYGNGDGDGDGSGSGDGYGYGSGEVSSPSSHEWRLVVIGEYCVVRTQNAGVHCGYLDSQVGREVVLKDARRLWQWQGAFTLHTVATAGVKRGTKMPGAVPKILLTEAIEVIPCSDEARDTLRGWPVHKGD